MEGEGGRGRRNCIRGQPTWRGTRVYVSLGLAAFGLFFDKCARILQLAAEKEAPSQKTTLTLLKVAF